MNCLANELSLAHRTTRIAHKHQLGISVFHKDPTLPYDRGNESQEARKVPENHHMDQAMLVNCEIFLEKEHFHN
uniref:Uncharacterized protein n=1 Tax=Lepeophtheirus salmonis TaxID=72036 RepID=A0A0K2URV6_LEPSM